jgi:TolB-like protein/DNA-binding winged helix-turn-helix (wHTH) protein/Tfp pilus assembly protein PilF
VPFERRSSTPFRFGPFEVDPVSGELRKQGVRVKLQEQPLQILQVLLERPGDVVTREELRQRLWAADTFVDFDHGLYNAIKRLREALGDVAETPRFIETVPKRGYRFIAPVISNGHLAGQEQVGVAGISEMPSSHTPSQTRPRRKALFVLVAAGSLGLVFTLFVGLNLGGAGSLVRAAWAKPPQIHSIAVLPLKNLSDDPAQEYFSYGMTEELITDLAQVSGLKVISHTSVIQYAKSTKSLPQIARELGVDGIVEGTVQRSGDRVRITAQLIYAPQEQHLWAASYDRDLRDALTLQSSVAAAIVEPIRSRTSAKAPIPRKPHTSTSLQAMDDYLQGNYSLQRMASGDGHEGYAAAIQYFRKAISEDPDFALPYIGLARAYGADYDGRPDEKLPLQSTALRKALELDPGSADAHLMMADIGVDCHCRLTCDEQEREIKEAIRLNPNLAEAHDRYACYLHDVGRAEESILETERARELDPDDRHRLGTLMADGQYDRVIELEKQYLELHPDDGFAYIDDGLINAYHFAGRHRESVEALQRAWTLFGFKEIGEGVGKAYADSGYAGALKFSAKQMEHLYAEQKVWKPDWIASWYARAGDKEQALKWIRVLVADTGYCMPGLDRDPDFASLHSEPRFQDLVKRSTAH